jgi:hypothetical protein
LFDLTLPRRRSGPDLTDREVSDAAWEEHVSERFGTGQD